MLKSNKFQALFKKYRLKAEFSTLSQLGFALAEKGLIYEDSIFSHWQKGDRVPNRPTILKLLQIFSERQSIKSVQDANEFLESAGEGYLTELEAKKIQFNVLNSVPFQVPNQIDNFTGREALIKDISKDIYGKIILIHGAAGVGKSALAIKLGHLLKDKFTDGVLWYKVEEDNIMDILLSIAHICGEDINNISDKQVRVTIVRSLLVSKNILLFLDSAEVCEDIYLLIPNSKFCTTIITSQKDTLKLSINYTDIELKPFTNNEVLSFFKKVLKEKHQRNDTKAILKISKRVGNLPLALHILAREVLHSKLPIDRLHILLDEENPVFQNLYATIALSYKKLDSKMKSILTSASIFQGKDFSYKSIAYINGLSGFETTGVLQNLTDLSLIEHSTKNRYRIHPEIREFVRSRLNYPRSSYLVIIASIIFLFFAIWWVFLQLFVGRNNILYGLFATSYFLLPFYGGVYALHTSQKWGGLKSLLGKAILMFSLGLFMQVFGQIMYAYYTNFKHIQVPYPSLGDIGYFGTIPFYAYGVILLAKSSGIKISIKSFKKKVIAFVIPLII